MLTIFFDSVDDHSNRVDEEPLLEVTDEQILPAGESTVDSWGNVCIILCFL